MSEMVERVEDAMIEAIMDQELFSATIGKQAGKLWITGEAAIDLAAVARAAIEAMREPTEAMVSEVENLGDVADGAGAFSRSDARFAWHAMIDASLKEPAKG